MKLLPALIAVCAATAVSAAPADDIYAKYFASVNGSKPCYARSYDAAHLKAHPKQTVRQIQVDYDASWRSDAGGKNTAGDFQAGISFMLKRSGEWFGQQLNCKTAGNGFDCYLDADGGAIRLTPAGHALKLEVKDRGGPGNQIAVEGEKGVGEFGAAGGDDRVFILPRADRKLCDAANQS